ncbi:MAG: TVP38/TMEM64 family protein [Gemmatimonadaceae bacterium]|nr:TVP38/TMEM64 family protein [Gemmatimonadaceae bacterium]
MVALVAAALLLALGRAGGEVVPTFAAWVRDFGAWGPAAFVAGYVVATVAGIPGSLLTLAAGATFGVWAGTFWSFLGATLGASAAFVVARHLARGAIERRAAVDPRFGAIDRAVAAEGRRIVFLLRLSPAIPFVLLNYLLGCTRVRFRDFVIASVGMLPGTLLYVYTGKVAGEIAVATAGRAPARGTGYYIVLALGLAATAAVTILITRTARRALRAAAVTADDAPATAIGRHA